MAEHELLTFLAIALTAVVLAIPTGIVLAGDDLAAAGLLRRNGSVPTPGGLGQGPTPGTPGQGPPQAPQAPERTPPWT